MKSKIFICPICEKEFKVYKCFYSKKTKYPRTCSRKCANKIKTKTDKLRKIILTYYLSKEYSANRIGKLLNISHDSVREFLKRNKIKIRPKGFYTSGKKNANYKRGYTITASGYARRKGKLVHREVMEKFLGRKLKRFEHVHHLNGNKLDNRLENLAVLVGKKHGALHAKLYHSWRKMYQDRIMQLEKKLNGQLV